MSDLKPCPFCGGEAKMIIAGKFKKACCANPSCDIRPETGISTDKNAVIEAWNRRAET